jgi:hypothetical protein
VVAGDLRQAPVLLGGLVDLLTGADDAPVGIRDVPSRISLKSSLTVCRSSSRARSPKCLAKAAATRSAGCDWPPSDGRVRPELRWSFQKPEQAKENVIREPLAYALRAHGGMVERPGAATLSANPRLDLPPPTPDSPAKTDESAFPKHRRKSRSALQTL